jgi:hypothetical protein
MAGGIAGTILEYLKIRHVLIALSFLERDRVLKMVIDSTCSRE